VLAVSEIDVTDADTSEVPSYRMCMDIRIGDWSVLGDGRFTQLTLGIDSYGEGKTIIAMSNEEDLVEADVRVEFRLDMVDAVIEALGVLKRHFTEHPNETVPAFIVPKAGA